VRSAAPARVPSSRNLAPGPVSPWRNLVVPRVPITEVTQAAAVAPVSEDQAETTAQPPCGCEDPSSGPATRPGRQVRVADTCDTPRFAANPGLFEAMERLASLERASSRTRPVVPPAGSAERSALDEAIVDAVMGQEIPTDQVYLLAVATKLNLGSDASGPLEVEVPFGYASSTSKATMLSTFLGAWEGYLHPESADWASKVIDRGTRAQLPSGTATGVLDWVEDMVAAGASGLPLGGGLGDAIPGLFWTEDYLNGALVMAVQTAYAFAPLLALMAPEAVAAGGYRGSELVREFISGTPSAVTGVKNRLEIRDGIYLFPNQGGITIYESGQVELVSRTGPQAMWWLNSFLLYQGMRDKAALADYMFWWAHRLHGMSVETGDGHYKDMGILAAKCGLAQVVKLAAIIVHEIGHFDGWNSAWHCAPDVGCNQYIAEFTFENAVRALLGLPGAVEGGLGPQMWEFTAGDDYSSFGYVLVHCPGSEFFVTHDGTTSGHASSAAPIYAHAHDVAFEVRVSAECGGTGSTFSVRLTPGDLHAWVTKGSA
jgi:hypothetical protein